ncbi:aldose 1-epimerase [Phenylobacterium sp.]|uniref:aldose 1-epimerase n=1 Tax=Phenylobacterium sp. TaxID=1871053 RepID=UPI003918D339
MGDMPQIGGAPVVTLKADAPPGRSGFVEATILPGRGMMLLQARVRRPPGDILDALFAPPVEEAARRLDGGPDDFAGNQAFLFGGAILAPFANRIRGRPLRETREIEAHVDGRRVRLPRNWGGKAPGAEEYAMHGLILDAAVPFEQPGPERVTGRLEAGDFGGRWPSQTELAFDWRLNDGALSLRIEAVNVGAEVLPMGIGWHPYFALPSGDRRQARLRLAAALRAEVNDYDEVLPTGRLQRTRGSVYDFGGETGAALGDLHIDDCFTGLRREGGRASVEVHDPAGGLGFRIDTPSPAVKAVQVFAPPDRPFVALEPQFNLADPFGEVWPAEVDTGMARLPPGGRTSYEVRLCALAVGT